MKRTKIKVPSISPEGIHWPKGLTPFPFQLDALPFAIRRLKTQRAVYFAVDAGLGKTIESAMLSNLFQKLGPLRILYVCPPSLTANVEAEFKKWGIPPSRMPTIWEDSKLFHASPGVFDLAFIDEAHRFMNEKTQRAIGLRDLLSSVPYLVFLSGTPMPNSRPLELWPILKEYAPDVFGTDFFSFAKKYCGARQVVAYGNVKKWKFDGFTSRAEFKSRLFSSFMLRQKKDLIDLPEKREGLLTVGEKIPPLIGKLEAKVLAAYSKEDLIEGRLAKKAGKEALHLAEYMRLLGTEKLKSFFPYLEHLIYDTKENIILFAHHKEVIDALALYLVQFRPIVISGATPTKARHGLVQHFQAGKTRFAVMNIVAGGIGWNLTRADRVIFVEFSWRDGDNSQGGDRAHRIGRTKPVLVQYVVLKDSLDAKRMGTVLRKRQGAV
jgi:SNF2 family DNA or RNA helicase